MKGSVDFSIRLVAVTRWICHHCRSRPGVAARERRVPKMQAAPR
jgi:hypothetical protein